MEAIDKIREIIIDELCIENDEEKAKITPEASLALVGDSLVKLEILCAVEEQFDLPRTPDAAIVGMKTVQDIAAYVQQAKAS